MPSQKPRHNLHLDAELTRQLVQLSGGQRMSKTRIIEAALQQYFEHQGTAALDTMLQTRLNRLSNQLDRLERDQHIVMHTLAEFVRHHFLVTGAPPEAELVARRPSAERRYQTFIDTVSRQLASRRKPRLSEMEAAQ